MSSQPSPWQQQRHKMDGTRDAKETKKQKQKKTVAY